MSSGNAKVTEAELEKDLGPRRVYSTSPSSSRMPAFASVLAVIAILYFGKEVLLPLAIAVLLTFALAPISSRLRKLGLPRIAAVIITVVLAFLVLVLFGLVVAGHIAEVVQNLPAYQGNIIAKIRSLQEGGTDSGIVRRLTSVVESVGRELSNVEERPVAPGSASRTREPVLVEIFAPSRPIETLTGLIGPLLGPIASLGLIIVVVIFMLLEREELRDRFIRLVGYGDLHRTTEAIQEAGSRVAQYLLMQLVVNCAYGVPLAFGLWAVGIPNPALWGMLAIVLRFVPYIGPVIATVLPLFLAFAVDPGWSLVLWVAAIFVVLELTSNNVIEPWLYGSRTGLSPLAIIVAAIFWAWLWGPVGLVLSTPLTVCLAVLGRYVPQFEFLEVVFGSDPVLDPKERLYQRLLAGDPDEATDYAEEFLEEDYLEDYYGKVAIPALLLAEKDRRRGVLTAEQMEQVFGTAITLVSNLGEIAEEEEDEQKETEAAGRPSTPLEERNGDESELPDGRGKTVFCVGGRGSLDDASAAMLAQILQVQGAEVVSARHSDIPNRAMSLVPKQSNAIVVCFLNKDSTRHATILVRRFKRMYPAIRVGAVLWVENHEEEQPPALEQADFVATTLTSAAREALADAPPSLVTPARKIRTRRSSNKTGITATPSRI
ncbi:putative PurR-regulated permease PerM [Rhizobium sp. BK650]|uniref:AI-2E family transporter n=1 Tax=Rhizobium sp. BK650 TaxID=2586990 RepID=UPI0016157BD5|nr:AI-2E family transporter [Rhizobium sp. BK650]MBB3661084.1 putative PurR-regulated permease PerM [Rhizobium sp. BK650]